MKRKSRKSKAPENVENGENDIPEENGESVEEEPVEKKKKKTSGANKRGGRVSLSSKSTSKINVSNNDKDSEQESTEQTETENAEEDPQYEVESILDEKNIQGVRHYLIRWKGYEPESDTWEPESTLNCSELIAEFRAKNKKKKGGSTKSPKSSGGGGTKPKRSKSTDNKNDEEEEKWDENENFEVDRILEVHFRKNGKREFLVSWKGYPQSQNSWEPEENMNCPELIASFMAKVEKAKETEQRELRVTRPHTDRYTLEMYTGSKGRRLSKRNQGRQRVHYHDAE